MSVTPAERKALVFLAALLALGGVARSVASLRDRTHAHRSPADSVALAAQLAAIDSQRAAERLAGRRRAARSSRARASVRDTKAAAHDSTLLVDVDRASAAELEALPRIGPALARRIVRDREENGPFGSVTGLLRVKGIGPKLVTHIAPYVTFSGSVRLTRALSVSLGPVPRASRPPPHG